MLLELAIGDAYGAGFEYVDDEIVAMQNDLTRYLRRHTTEVVQGRYTDDTQMSLAIAEAIVSGEPWTPQNLATRFLEVFHRDPRSGYAHGFYNFLRTTRSGVDFLRLIRPDSDKSGAAMRAAPIGVFATPEEVIEKATLQARLTHDTPNGIVAAQAAALMTHYFLYGHGAKRDLGLWLEGRLCLHRWSDPWRGHVGSKGWMSVRAAVTAVITEDSLSDILRACIAYTGDVDTVATLALAAASCSSEVTQDLPNNLIVNLENGRYGREYLQKLDTQLMARVVRPEE